MDQTLLRGREFSDADRAGSAPACIVSDGFARRFWPAQNPIGKRVKWGRLDGPRPWLTVVGVVADNKVIADPRDGEVVGMIALPLAQMVAADSIPVEEVTFILETNGSTIGMESAIRAALTRVDSRVAPHEMIRLSEAAAQSRVTERFIFVLVSLFGVLGLLLAGVGLYGLLSLQVARREREFGIRSALGASAVQLIQLVARQGATLLGSGFVVGALATWGVVRIIQNHWSTMPAPNITAWLLGAIVLCLAVALACLIPARRAAQIDPVIALRAE